MTTPQLSVLETLRDHPLLSRRQLELHLGLTGRMARKHLARLQQTGLVRTVNARLPGLDARSLWALTDAGIRRLAELAGEATEDYRWRFRLDEARLSSLILHQERVFQVRTLLLWLEQAQWNWRVVKWDVEVEASFWAGQRMQALPLHGAAQLTDANGNWLWLAIEFDLERVPVEQERQRIARFVQAQDDPRFWSKEGERSFPILVVIAQDEWRLQDYYSLLQRAALSQRLPLPRSYLALSSDLELLREDITAPIWFSGSTGRQTSLLFGEQGHPRLGKEGELWRKPVYRRRPNLDRQQPTDMLPGPKMGATPEQLASLALSLQPLDKQLLDEIARHPLLDSVELATVLSTHPRSILRGLAQLTHSRLVQAHAAPSMAGKQRIARKDGQVVNSTCRYVLSEKGVQYLAEVAGLGREVEQYARARGWGMGFQELVEHWEHTRMENDLFLKLAREAQRRGHKLTWLSELEGRLYYGYERRRHSFLPDGRGIYQAEDEQWELAVEVDRSRSSKAKFQRKLNEYYACVGSRVLRQEGYDDLLLLVVTNSWERADTLCGWIGDVGQPAGKAGLKILITTIDRLQVSGVAAAIWLDTKMAIDSNRKAWELDKLYCFDCFVSVPSSLGKGADRVERTGQIKYRN